MGFSSMIPGLSNLIDALKDGKISVLMAGVAASFTAWLIIWPYKWISHLALVVGVFCSISLLWQAIDWLWKANRRWAQRRHSALSELRFEVQKVCREFRAIYGRTVEGRLFAGRVSSLYLELQRQGLKTPDMPPKHGPWSIDTHLSYLETIIPYLKPAQIKDARRAAATYMREL
ncbi:MAG: hypothetical protein ABJN05_17335 [Sulfitobacter dubius]